MTFVERLELAAKRNNSLVCVGLDTDIQKIPRHLRNDPHPLFSFNRAVIENTHDLVCAYKPNIAYYEAQGTAGMLSLVQTIDYIHDAYPQIPVILDAKRGDIGTTSERYAHTVFGELHADAVTLSPYMGLDSLEPFLRYREKGCIVLCRTSNPGAIDFQDMKVNGGKLYTVIAKTVARWNRTYGNCLLVVGATWPKQMKEIRDVAKKMWFLVPGIGSQGGELEDTLRFGLRKDNSGLLISASRSIIYAGDGAGFAKSVRKETMRIRDSINEFR